VARDYLASIRSHDAQGVLYVNTLGIKTEPTLGVGELDASSAADEFWLWLGTEYRACIPSSYTVDTVHLRGILGTSAAVDKSIGTNGTLSAAGGAIPREVAFVITWRTAIVGRSGRGRMYLPSPKAGSISGTDYSTWDTGSAIWAAALTFGNKVLAGRDYNVSSGLFTGHMSGRVYSRAHGANYDIRSFTRQPQARWLRSRRSAP
jgi:hypothetical protein